MTRRAEFPKSVKLTAWERSGGRCECGCGVKIIGTPHYDHYPIPAGIGGPGTLENCRVLDPKCHRVATLEHDTPAVKDTTRIFEKRIGAREKRRGFAKPPPGYDPWSRRMRGE